MYYEEKTINGVLYFRTNPKGSWKEKATQYFICKHLSGMGMWVLDCDTLSTQRHTTCRKVERIYGADWFMDDNFEVVEVKIQEVLKDGI